MNIDSLLTRDYSRSHLPYCHSGHVFFTLCQKQSLVSVTDFLLLAPIVSFITMLALPVNVLH